MSLRGTKQSHAIQSGSTSVRLPRFARNDIKDFGAERLLNFLFLIILPFKPPICLFGKHQGPSP